MMRFAIIGTNFISHSFMRAANLIDDFELVAVCSGKLENAKAFANEYNVDYYTDDYREIIEKIQIDAVYVATPNSMHFEHSSFFLKNKVHVLCEKPLASNITEVKNLISLAQENHTLLMEAIKPITLPNYFKTKDTLSELGTIRRAFFAWGKYSSRYDDYRNGVILNAFKNELSNGSLMDLGIYSVYNVISLFGVPDRIVTNGFLLDTRVDGIGSAIFTYPEMEAIILHSKITDSYLKSEIQGEDGTLIITMNSNYLKVELGRRNENILDISVPQIEDTMYYELTEFMECIKEGEIESKIVPYKLMINVHQIMTDIRADIGIIFPADLK